MDLAHIWYFILSFFFAEKTSGLAEKRFCETKLKKKLWRYSGWEIRFDEGMISSENLVEAHPEVPPTPKAFFSSTSAMSSSVNTFEANMTALGNHSWSPGDQFEAANSTSSIDNFFFYEVNMFCYDVMQCILCDDFHLIIWFFYKNLCKYIFENFIFKMTFNEYTFRIIFMIFNYTFSVSYFRFFSWGFLYIFFMLLSFRLNIRRFEFT